MKKRQKTCQQIIAEKMQDARTRKVQETFNQLEADAIREFLSKDAPTRERERLAQSTTH